MATVSESESLLKADGLPLNYLSLAGLTLLLYDHVLTFNEEVSTCTGNSCYQQLADQKYRLCR